MSAIEHEMDDDEYEEMLNDTYEPVSVCGYMYDQGTLLKEIDPVAFRCGKLEEEQWECSECSNVYDDCDKAEECWKTCQDTAECDLCGEPFIRKDDTGRFCSDKCRQADENNLNSHLADPEEIDWDKDDPDWSIRLDSSGL